MESKPILLSSLSPQTFFKYKVM